MSQDDATIGSAGGTKQFTTIIKATPTETKPDPSQEAILQTIPFSVLKQYVDRIVFLSNTRSADTHPDTVKIGYLHGELPPTDEINSVRITIPANSNGLEGNLNTLWEMGRKQLEAAGIKVLQSEHIIASDFGNPIQQRRVKLFDPSTPSDKPKLQYFTDNAAMGDNAEVIVKAGLETLESQRSAAIRITADGISVPQI